MWLKDWTENWGCVGAVRPWKYFPLGCFKWFIQRITNLERPTYCSDYFHYFIWWRGLDQKKRVCRRCQTLKIFSTCLTWGVLWWDISLDNGPFHLCWLTTLNWSFSTCLTYAWKCNASLIIKQLIRNVCMLCAFMFMCCVFLWCVFDVMFSCVLMSGALFCHFQ